MPLERLTLSASCMGEELGVDPTRIIGVKWDGSTRQMTVLLEPEDMQTKGTYPQLSDNTSRRMPKPKPKPTKQVKARIVSKPKGR